jgi:hypothetical protein
MAVVDFMETPVLLIDNPDGTQSDGNDPTLMLSRLPLDVQFKTVAKPLRIRSLQDRTCPM